MEGLLEVVNYLPLPPRPLMGDIAAPDIRPRWDALFLEPCSQGAGLINAALFPTALPTDE